MNYYLNTLLQNTKFEEAIEKVTEELKKEGFGIITEIDVQSTLRQKIDVDFRRYIILGACNPHFAHQALLAESKIGILLPCNVIVDEIESGLIEISAVDPVAAMGVVQNTKLSEFAIEIRQKLQRVIDCLQK